MISLRSRLLINHLATSWRARAVPRIVASTTHQRLYAHSGYGDGDGNPVSENPQDQGASPSADLEHPGPPPVAEGQGSGSTPTKGTSDGHNTDTPSSAQSPSSSSPRPGSGSDSGSGSGSSGRAQPKIHDERSGPTPGQQGVEEHNQDFEKRYDRANAGSGDKVDKNFWKGMGGADRQP